VRPARAAIEEALQEFVRDQPGAAQLLGGEGGGRAGLRAARRGRAGVLAPAHVTVHEAGGVCASADLP